MKILRKSILALVMLSGLTTQTKGAEVFKNDDLDLFVGGRLQTLGEVELVTDDPVRYHNRVYLFNPEARLTTNGTFKGYKWNFETAFGGEAINSTNNQLNLKEFNADVPLIEDMAYIKVGQFKVPTNLESAVYEGNQIFTSKSLLYNMFFNTGYDNGLSLWGKLGQMDFAGGVLSGAPNLPQRYLPELFQFPPLTFARVGFNDGISDDPFHQKQTGFAKPDRSLFAAHISGIFGQDSNAGHSTDLSLQSGYTGTFSANGDYGNMMLYTLWNPYLGKVAALNTSIQAYYWTAGVDAQLRAPVGDTVFTLSAQVNASQFNSKGFAPVTLSPGNVATSGQINIGGAEVIASFGDNPWEIAGRFAMVIPDAAFRTKVGTNTTLATITGSDPIYEITLPSIVWHMNEDVKLIGEAMWSLNTPEVFADDGIYVLTEMPTQAASATTSGGNTSKISRAGMIPAGRMMFQFQY